MILNEVASSSYVRIDNCPLELARKEVTLGAKVIMGWFEMRVEIEPHVQTTISRLFSSKEEEATRRRCEIKGTFIKKKADSNI